MKSKPREMKILFLAFATICLLSACGGGSSDGDTPAGSGDGGENSKPANPDSPEQGDSEGEDSVFNPSFLVDYLQWENVHPEGEGFVSAGHCSGADCQSVRAFFNEAATSTYEEYAQSPQEAVTFAEGSVLAKEVMDPSGEQDVMRLYLMRKMPAGFDPENGDWAYAVAEPEQGELIFTEDSRASGGKMGACISCHTQSHLLPLDGAQTLELYQQWRE